MSDVTPGSIAQKVIDELPNFFRDGFDQLVTGEGEYIRAGEPRGQVGKIGQAVARSYCRQYGANPAAARFGNKTRIENACRPYLDDIDPGNGPAIVVPVRGGQCDLRCYGVDITTTSPNTGQTATSRVRIKGPITGFRRVPTSPGNFRSEAFSRSVGQFGFNCGQTTPPQWNSAGSGGDSPTATHVIVDANQGGDICGNAPPVVRPPTGIPDPTGPRFPFNPDPFIDIDVGVDVDADGKIFVDIGTGPIQVDIFPPTDAPAGGPPPEAPGDVGEADTEAAEDAEGDEPASGCAGANQVLGGLKIAVTTSPPSARIYAPGIFRGAAYIYMGAEGNLDQDFGGSMLRDGQFFLPEKENLTCWEVRANIGYRLRVTPYYKTIEEDG